MIKSSPGWLDGASTMNLIDKIFFLLSRRQRAKTLLLIPLNILCAAVETLGIASITPFLAVLGLPEVIDKSQILHSAYIALGMKSREEFLFVLGLLALAGQLTGIAFRALNTWATTRFSRGLDYSISCRLMTDYLRRPYVFFLGRNSANLTKMVLSETGQVVGGFLSPAIGIVANVVVMVFLLAMLCIANPVVALATTAIVGAIYGAIFFTIKRWLVIIGERRFAANQKRFETAAEVFGGIKEVKLLGCEDVYFKRFSRASSEVAVAAAAANLAGSMPGYSLEVIASCSVVMIVLYLLHSPADLATTLPLLGLYILCARRMLPAVQGIFKNVTTLRFSLPALSRLLADFHERETEAEPNRCLSFTHTLKLKGVSFTYPQSRKPAISNMNLTIPIGTRVGFVGATGSGKTTTMDVILGLLPPSKGQVLIDGAPLGPENIRSWQRTLGYVPQHIYLADDTVTNNIAFGVRPDQIDHEAVEWATRLANIHDFVVDEMPQGYATMVGERGIRLSGGQRQRIGIARALYRDPSVLFFDEATSALDTVTEKAVTEALRTLGRERTIILVAHRLSTVRDCDVIYLFDGGSIRASGNYDELTVTSPKFQALIGLG